MKITCSPGEYKPITITTSDRGRPTALTINDALELYTRLGRAILDAITAAAREGRA